MKPIESFEEIKKIELEILISFDNFCRKHGLEYSLGAGTMLGAVRHKGFIPWDDDIDVFMMRSEYDKFASMIKNGEGLDNSIYQVKLPEEKDCLYPFIKIINSKTLAFEKNINKKYALGIWIDILPIDYCGNTLEEAEKNVDYLRKLNFGIMRSAIRLEGSKFSILARNIYHWVWENILRHNSRIYKDRILEYKFSDSGKFAGTVIWTYPSKDKMGDVYPAEYFNEYMETEFENRSFMMFSKYDEILRHRFGNYMELPNEEDRLSHGMRCFYIADKLNM